MSNIKSIFENNDFTFSLIKSHHIIPLSEEMVFFRFTDFPHDNDTLIGFCQRNIINIQKFEKKLQRKKWSKGKIDRFIKDKQKSLEQNYQSRNPWNEDINKSFTRWYNLIAKLLTLNEVVNVGIIYHWYSSLIENDQIEPVFKKNIKIKELQTETLSMLMEDELLLIGR